jgi:hypothetical protein
MLPRPSVPCYGMKLITEIEPFAGAGGMLFVSLKKV